MKHVVCTSSGAGSAMAGKLVAERYGTDNLTLLFADVNMEHPDNYRFLAESTVWIGGTLVTLDNGGKTIWDVFKAQRFLGNTRVDLCSRVLKREPMRNWLEANCDPASTVAEPSEEDVLIAVFDFPELAEHIVRLHNMCEKPSGGIQPEEDW